MAIKADKHDRDSSDLINGNNKRRAIEPDYTHYADCAEYLDHSCGEIATPAPPSPITASDIAGHLRQTQWTAQAALNFYNTKHHTNYSLVDPVNSGGRLWAGGIWYHVNFKAKPESSSESSKEPHGDSSSKLFFAELKVAGAKSSKEFLVTACCPIDETKSIDHCEMCEGEILHPTKGFRQGLYQFKHRELRQRHNGKVQVISRTT